MVISISGLLAIAVIASAMKVWAEYRSDIRVARERVHGRSDIAAWLYGDIEYTEGGAGPDVLVIHGAGGGYDQGELIAQAVLNERFHWIAPSRFGYLRSGFRVGATFDEQARAFACLLDHLGIQRVAVVAVSAGGPSALLFALLYPERVASLTLISCGVAAISTEGQTEADKKGGMLIGIFKKDFRYWMVAKIFKKQLMQLMGADETVIRGLSSRQLELIERFISYMNPASLRYSGAVLDHTAALPGNRIAAIKAPTLIIHAEDDTLQLYHNAVFAFSKIPGARLLHFTGGGHFVMGIEQAAVRGAVQKHILDNLGILHEEPIMGRSADPN
jgi:pimeloyl-ACP methyl ester carboxylesterase